MQPPPELLLRRSESEARAVLEDWLREHGRSARSVLPVGRIYAAAYAAVYADHAAAYAYAYTYVDADAADRAAADSYADADADADDATADHAAAYAYTYVDASADVDASASVSAYADVDAHQFQKQFINSIKNSEDEMTQGFAILFSTGTYFSSCRMGWLRQVTGDEWEIDSARNVRRTTGAGIMALAQCKAKNGLGGHELGDVDTEPESVHRLHMLKAIRIPRTDWPLWVKEFPALKERLEAAP